MKIFIALEARFYKYNNSNDICITEYTGAYQFWQNYLKVFESVVVIARFKKYIHSQMKHTLASGEGVSFFQLPDFVGPLGALIKLPKIIKRLWRVSAENGVFLLRIPGGVGTLLWMMLILRKKSYAVEIVSFPENAYSLKSSGSLFISFAMKPLMVWLTKLQCANAEAISYVTMETLQKKYASQKAKIIASYSDVILTDKIIKSKDSLLEYRWKTFESRFKIIFVGSLERPYKGVDVLLEAFSELLRKKTDVELWIIGDGKLRRRYELQSKRLGIMNYVYFLGKIDQNDLIDRLFNSHLFVLPSRIEGLPRAMIEAMATGLPCIGTNVGGIPELLSQEALVEVDDAVRLSEKMEEFTCNHEKLKLMGKENRDRAIAEFHPELLGKRRDSFFLGILNLFKKYEL